MPINRQDKVMLTLFRFLGETSFMGTYLSLGSPQSYLPVVNIGFRALWSVGHDGRE